MTDLEKEQKGSTMEEKPVEKTKANISNLSLAIIFMAIIAMAAYLGRETAQSSIDESGTSVQSRVEDATLLPRLQEVEKQAKATAERLHVLEQKGSAESTAAASPSSTLGQEDLARIQRDLGALSSVLVQLETQVKQSAQVSDRARDASFATAEAVIRFVRFQAAVLSGGTFATELQAMKKALEADGTLMPVWEKLEPLAARGVPSLSDLRALLAEVEAPLAAALRKERAQTWRERILAALEGLIAVRKVNHLTPEEEMIAAIDQDIFQRRLSAALDKARALSPAVQPLLERLIEQVEARRNAEEAMNLLVERLTLRALPEGETPKPVDVPAEAP